MLGSLVVEFFLDFGNCMAMIDLRGFWIGFGLRGEGTDSVVVICERQLLLPRSLGKGQGHGGWLAAEASWATGAGGGVWSRRQLHAQEHPRLGFGRRARRCLGQGSMVHI